MPHDLPRRLLRVPFLLALWVLPGPRRHRLPILPRHKSSAPAGFTQISADTLYTAEKGYGFEPSTAVLPTPGQGARAAVAPTLQSGKSLSSDKAFIFSAAVPEGNYRVTLTLGDPDADSTTTVKAEARRLMVEHVQIPKGTSVTRSFMVNVRRPEIPEHTMLTPLS